MKTRTQKKCTTLLFTMMLIALLAICSRPVQAAVHIDEVEYEGKGRVEIEFKSDVKYKNLKVTAKDASGKTAKVRITDKNEDELEFKIINYKRGTSYTYKITGIYKKGEKKSSTITGKIKIPKNSSTARVKEIDYDSDDKEVEFEFKSDVKWKSAKVTITKDGKNYVKKIDDKDDDSIEVKVKELKKGVTYHYTISGIKAKGSKNFGTITGSFRP